MILLRTIFLCVLISINSAFHSAHSNVKQCNIEDAKCVTYATTLVYSTFIAGFPGVESSEPLHIDLIEANLPTVKYTLRNGTLSGMKNCFVEYVELVPSTWEFKYYVGCPHLILDGEYALKSTHGAHYLEEHGTTRVKFYDYQFHYSGYYKNVIKDDGDVHLDLTNYALDIKAGGVEYEYKQFVHGGQEISHTSQKYVDENWHIMDKLTRTLTIETFMKKFFGNAQAYVDTVPLKHMFLYV